LFLTMFKCFLVKLKKYGFVFAGLLANVRKNRIYLILLEQNILKE
jgi:hypothetical protein